MCGDGEQELPLAERERRLRLRRQELRERAFERAPRPLETDQPADAGALRDRLEFIDLLATPGRAPRHADPAHAATGLQRRLDDPRLALCELGGEVLDLEPIAEVGAVAAVALHGIGIAHAREGGLHRDPRLGPERLDHPLRERDDVLTADERRLDVDLGELELPIGAQVLVTEAAGDLEVAVEPRAHEELLVDLRRLWEGVELPRTHPARDEEVARPLRRRLREDRGLELQIPLRTQVLPRGLHQAMPEHEGVLEFLASQIEDAMPEPELFGGELPLLDRRDWEGGRHRWSHHADRRRPDLDAACRHLRIEHLRRTRRHRPLDHHHALDPDRRSRRDRLCRRPMRVERALHHPTPVPEVEEDLPPEVTRAMDPAAEHDRGPDVGGAQGAGQVGTQGGGERRSGGSGHDGREEREGRGCARTREARAPVAPPRRSAIQSATLADRPGI